MKSCAVLDFEKKQASLISSLNSQNEDTASKADNRHINSFKSFSRPELYIASEASHSHYRYTMSFISQHLSPRQDITDRPIYDHTENNAQKINIITGVLFGLAMVFFILRIYVRIVFTKLMGADDWSMVVAMILTVLVVVASFKETSLGIGRHETDPVFIANFEGIFFWLWMRSLFIVTAICVTKVSVGFFLLRIMDGSKYKRLIQGMIVFLFMFTFSSIFVLIFQCRPVEAAWQYSLRPNPWGTGGTARCYTQNTFRNIGLINGAINIITDFFFVTLPIAVIWGLSIDLRTKITIAVILSVGYFACAAAIVKEVLLVDFFNKPDFPYENQYAIWNLVELTAGIIAACLPALRPLFSFFSGKVSQYNTKKTGMTNNPNHQYYMQSSDINLDYVNKNTGDKYDINISTHQAGPRSRLEKSLQEDDDSEKGILVDGTESDMRNRDEGIVRTTEVRIT